MNYVTRAFINIATLVVVLAVNILANALPINNLTTAEISDSFPTLFTPPGYVFSIWGLIYLLLIGFTVYQALPSQANNKHVEKVSYYFALSNILNSIWIFTWHYELLSLSLLLTVGLLISLAIIYSRLRTAGESLTAADRFLVRLPFSIYLAWASVATIANTAVLLYSINWSGWGISPAVWTVIMIYVGAALAIYYGIVRKDGYFALVFIWAFTGIAVGQSSITAISINAWIASGLVLLTAIYALTASQKGKTISST